MKNTLSLLAVLISGFLQAQTTFDIQGHRGARGLYPENSIPGFIAAVKLGVNTLEMDVVVSKDGQLVVSHEPWMNEEICDVRQIGKDKNNIYALNYSEIAQIDCGSKINNRFPGQEKFFAAKPRLRDVIDSVESYLAVNKLPKLMYNIETKTTPDGDGKFHPAPKPFVQLLYELLKEKNILSKCVIQSFDERTLQVLHGIDSSVKTALLVFNADGLEKNILRLGFVPDIYSPNFILVNNKLVKGCHQRKMQLIPWTVNEEKKMKQMKKLKVDGLISDYPDRAIKLFR